VIATEESTRLDREAPGNVTSERRDRGPEILLLWRQLVIDHATASSFVR
jgi:hypothetical protein